MSVAASWGVMVLAAIAVGALVYGWWIGARGTRRPAREGGTMNGYVIAPDGDAALAAIDDERVRYAAKMPDGSGLVAWDDSPPALAGRVMLNEADETWPWETVRHNRATEEDRFYLVSGMTVSWLVTTQIVALTPVDYDLYLLQTDTDLSGSMWGGRPVAYRQARIITPDYMAELETAVGFVER